MDHEICKMIEKKPIANNSRSAAVTKYFKVGKKKEKELASKNIKDLEI